MTYTIDGGVLAGGLSTRMQGNDKGLQLHAGQPMVEQVANAIKPYVSQLLICCNRNQEQYIRFADQICKDLVPGYKGPLAGIHSLLSVSNADYLLISPCDTPGLIPLFAKRMIAQLDSKNQAQATPGLFAAKVAEKYHPLHLLIHQSYLNALESSLNKGQLKAMRWLEEHGVKWIDFSDADRAFSNINTLQDLQP